MKSVSTLILSLSVLMIVFATAKETAPSPSFQSWMNDEAEGEGLPMNALAMNADPDHDGFSNLVEYAFDTDPLFPSKEGLPKLEQVDVNTLTYTFTLDRTKSDVSYEVQTSNDLKVWRTMESEIVASKKSIERRQVRLMANERAQFVRLVVRHLPSRS